MMQQAKPRHIAQSVVRPDLRARGHGLDTQSGHILSFLLPLIQEGHLLLAKVCA